MNFTVIVPTYNEAPNMLELVTRIKPFKPSAIFIIDDNSPDGTAKLAWELGCSILIRRKKMGLASAVIEGMHLAWTEGIVVMDADLQHPPELIPTMMSFLRDHDIVVASRYNHGGKVEGWPLSRRIVSRFANALAYPLAPKVKDRGGGFFAIRRSVIPEGLEGIGFKILLEILAKSNGIKVCEVPYTFKTRKRGDSKFSTQQVKDYLHQLRILYRGRAK